MSEPPPDNAPSPLPEPPPESPWVQVILSHPVVFAGLLILIAVLLAMSGWVIVRREAYQAEIARLRASMTELERERADAIVSQERNTFRLALALLRRQAQLEQTLHLAVSVDTGAMYLEREGALLREMPVQIGPERRVGIATDTVRMVAPRGVRTVTEVLTDSSAWEVPAWVYADRGIAVDSTRRILGALGPAALILDGGTVIYSMPTTGPLNDSLYVLPGAVRARADDLRAVLPNLTPGMRVYFY